ncbi:carbohydrate-binding protein, partial [Streptomyces sp. 6N223]|uniref:carbohydrate-binding protein n=1 Tax=Streptomyces sp. 6N223 TaxID=3457412 RepID=UPI003FD28D20
AYEVQAGASSRDIRCSETVTVDGDPIPPRPVMSAGLAAADFDQSHNIELVDHTKTAGDSTTPANHDTPGELIFHSCDLGTHGPGTVAITASAIPTHTPAEIELHAPGTTLHATIPIPDTGDPYTYTTIRQTLTHTPTGIHDLHITLHGNIRLHRIEFAAPSAE